MSLTGTHHAFVGLHEDGLNVAVEAFRAARPWLFSYGHPMLGGGAPPAPTTEIDAITMPSVGVSFPYRIDIPKLTIDCYPEQPNSGLPPELQPLHDDEFDIHADVVLTTLCPGKIQDGKVVKDRKVQQERQDLLVLRVLTCQTMTADG